MRKLIFSILILFSGNISGQTNGFQFLSEAKSSLESIVKVFAANIPDTSEVYKKYYFSIAKSYNGAKAKYDGYRGAMKDCLLRFDNKRKIQQCLQMKAINIKEQLDTLNYLVEMAYLEAYSKKIITEKDPKYSGKNTGTLNAEFIKAIVENLVSGTIKIWDQIKKYRKEYKEAYLNQISNTQYDLVNIVDLVKTNR